MESLTLDLQVSIFKAREALEKVLLICQPSLEHFGAQTKRYKLAAKNTNENCGKNLED